MPNVANTFLISSVVILDKTILDADVNDAAEIKFSKLDNDNIDSGLIPDGDNTRTCGTGSKRWTWGAFKNIVVSSIYSALISDGNGTRDIGSSSKQWKDLHLDNDIIIKSINAEIYFNCIN